MRIAELWSDRVRVAVLLAAAVFLTASPVLAQDTGLSFLGGLGYEKGGPGGALVDELVTAGLDGAQAGVCAGALCQDSTYYPFEYREGIGLTFMIGFQFKFDGPLSIDGLYANGQRGHAEGFETESKDHLILSYSSSVLASTLGVHLGPLRLGAGPAVLITGWDAVFNATDEQKSTAADPGVSANLSVSVRFQETLVSLRATVQRFRQAAVPNPANASISPDYRTFSIALMVNPPAG